MTRRSVVQSLALFLILATLTASAQKQPADIILRNGRIYTSDPQRPWAEALAIRGTKIVAVGAEADVVKMRGPRTRVIDLAGRMAMPGIIDSHIHFLSGSLSLGQIFLDDARSAAEIQRRVKEYAARHPGKKWLIGRGWAYDLFAPSGLPTKDIIDAVERERPVVLENYDGHSYWVNSKALELAGITRTTPDVKEGELTVGIIVRDPATGEATGVLKERATRFIDNVIQQPSREEKLAALRDGQRLANRHGLTSTLDASSSIEEMELYAELHRRGELTVRMTLALGMEPKLTPEVLKRYESARRRFRGEWVRAGVIKAFMDGVIESHTAAMLAPYADDPSFSGSMNYTPEQFNGLVRELDRRKFHVITHAIGDLGIRTALDAYEAAAKSNGPRDRRFRIEHIENIHPADIPRFGKLGVIASMQPLHGYPGPNLEAIWGRNVGPARMPNSFPWQAIAKGGGRLNFGSDWPVVTLDPFEGIQNAVTRQRTDGTPAGGWVPEQRVSLEQALAAYTRDAAWGQFEDGIKGTLTPGKLADVIVLSQDLFKISPLDIYKAKVVLTVVGGKIVHEEKEYTNSACGFTFRYPAGWTLHEQSPPVLTGGTCLLELGFEDQAVLRPDRRVAHVSIEVGRTDLRTAGEAAGFALENDEWIVHNIAALPAPAERVQRGDWVGLRADVPVRCYDENGYTGMGAGPTAVLHRAGKSVILDAGNCESHAYEALEFILETFEFLDAPPRIQAAPE